MKVIFKNEREAREEIEHFNRDIIELLLTIRSLEMLM